MALWRLLRGWDHQELRELIEDARSRPLNFSPPKEMTAATGWNEVASVAIVGRERPGEPVPDGDFERAQRLVESFEFSDPRIVVGHYLEDDALAHRAMLLELKALGLRFLCPVRVAGAGRDKTAGKSSAGFSICTLEGHIEAGVEHFLLEKDHATGLVRFRIRAAWRPGQFPNLWSRVGFGVVGRRYQRAWHRLAHLRLRRMLGAGAPRLLPDDLHLIHGGSPLPAPSVQFIARRAGAGAVTELELESERPRWRPWVQWAALGKLAGMRSILPLWVVSQGQGLLRPAAPLLKVLAAGELVADKLPMMPPRVQALPLAGRALFGGIAAALIRPKGAGLGGASAVGAVTAVASSFGAYHLRRRVTRRWGLPPMVSALLEDLAAAFLARRIMRDLG